MAGPESQENQLPEEDRGLDRPHRVNKPSDKLSDKLSDKIPFLALGVALFVLILFLLG